MDINNKMKIRVKKKGLLMLSFGITLVSLILFALGVSQTEFNDFAIVDVKFTGEISTNSSSNLLLVVANTGNLEKVRIQTATKNIQITPTVVEDVLQKELQVLYVLKTENSGSWKVTFVACSLDVQDRCVNRTITGNVLNTIFSRCGDNICQTDETKSICADDCDINTFIKQNPELTIKNYFLNTTYGKVLLFLLIISSISSLVLVATSIKVKK